MWEKLTRTQIDVIVNCAMIMIAETKPKKMWKCLGEKNKDSSAASVPRLDDFLGCRVTRNSSLLTFCSIPCTTREFLIINAFMFA